MWHYWLLNHQVLRNAAMQHLFVAQLHSQGRILTHPVVEELDSPENAESKYMSERWMMAFSSASPFLHPPPPSPSLPTPPMLRVLLSAHLRQYIWEGGS